MLDFFNSTLGIISSILVIISLLVGSACAVVKKIRQKAKDNGIANSNDGDAVNFTGESGAKGGNGSFNFVGNNNKIDIHTEGPFGGETPSTVVNLKNVCQVLFIDDEKLQDLINTLKRSGWKNVRRIDDTANLDVVEIRNANIIFVDIKGVGKELKFKNEGVGLAAELKRRYPQKGVVIYSATSEHNLFDPDIDKVDGRLFKNAEPIQFSNMIEQYGKPKN